MFGTRTERISKSPDYAGLGVAGDVGQTHAVAEVQDDEDRQPDPHQIARTAENAHPAEQDDGDDVEFEAFGHVAAHRAEPRRVEQPGQRGDRRPDATNSTIFTSRTRTPE